MNLIIVDGDCRNLWTMPELERLLDAGHDTIWFCEDAILREHRYDAVAAAQAAIGASFEKAILVTRLQNGVMGYHRQMLRNTVGCKRWLIVIVGEVSNIYKEQYCNEINSILGASVRYNVLFDDPSALSLALEAKREVVDDRSFCVIATRSNVQFAEDVRKTLELAYEDWRFECHVGKETDDYRHADVILVIGQGEEDCAVPPTKENASRVRIWLETPCGGKVQGSHVLESMNQSGWNLANRRIWSSCLANEILLQELDSGEISREALCVDDRFIIWDRYGLPLPACAYESAEQAESFLRCQCCFPELLDSKNGKEEILNEV